MKGRGSRPKAGLPAEHPYPGAAGPPSSPPSGARPWQSWKVSPLEEPTKSTGHRMLAGRSNRLGLSPTVEFKLNAKFRFPKGWD